MKPLPSSIFLPGLAVTILLGAGCSSVPDTYHDPDHVAYQEADHHVLTWTADEVSLGSPPRVHVALPVSTVVATRDSLGQEEIERHLQTCFADALNARLGPSSARCATATDACTEPGWVNLELTIVDCWAGDRGTSMIPLLGATGAGYPWILVRGALRPCDGGEPVFRFVVKRGFEGREAGDSWSGYEDPMKELIKDMALDVSELVERLRDHRPLRSL